MNEEEKIIGSHDDHEDEADGKSELTGMGGGVVDGTHPSTYTPANSSKQIIEDKIKQPGE